MANEFLYLVSSPLMNLDHTYRYSGTKLVEPESLSQHIVDTVMLGLKIIDTINSINRGKENLLDPSVYVMKAIYHDLEEVITGDIPRPLKYYDDDTLRSMRQVADEVAAKFFTSQFVDGASHYDTWSSAKEGDEGFILKLVDTLVVANKVIKEVSLLHNYYMLRVAHEVVQYLREFRKSLQEHPHYLISSIDEYIDTILSGAINSMETILSDHRAIMEKLDIYGQSMI